MRQQVNMSTANGHRRKRLLARQPNSLLLTMVCVALWAASATPTKGQPKNIDTIFVIDVSQSMVDDVQKLLITKNFATTAQSRFVPGNRKRIETFLQDPANESQFTNNILYRSVRLLEQIIDEYEKGSVYIMLFDNGPVDKGPLKAVTGPFYIAHANDPIKNELRNLLDPARHDPYTKAKEWRGIFVETVFRGGGPTLINTTCEQAMTIFERAAAAPGYTNVTHAQQLLLFTDGEELERGRSFASVLDRFRLQRNRIWFEYREVYLGPQLGEETKRIHERLSDAGFRPVYSDLWRRVRVTGSDRPLSGQMTTSNDEGTGVITRVTLQPPIQIRVQADDGKVVDGYLLFRLSDSSPKVPGINLSIVPDRIPVSHLPNDLELQLVVQSGTPRLESTEPFNLFLNVQWDLELNNTENTAPRTGASAGSGRPYVDYGSRRHLPISLRVVPETRIIRIRPVGTVPVARSSGDILEFHMENIESVGKVISLEADFSLAGKASRLSLISQAEPPDTLVFNNNQSFLELMPNESSMIVPFWIHAKASGGQTHAKVVLSTRSAPRQVVVSPTQAVIQVSFRTPSISLTFLDPTGARVPVSASINWGEVKEHHAARGQYPRPAGDSFELEFPPNLPPENGVTVSLTSHASQAFSLVRLTGTTEQPVTSGELFRENARFRLKLRQDIEPKEEVEKFEGVIVVAPATAKVLLNEKPEKVVVPLSVSIKRFNAER
jgi:hypothetical protein